MSEPKSAKRVKLNVSGSSSSSIPTDEFVNTYDQAWNDSDIILIIGESQFHCHSTVLQLCSPVFQVMFQDKYKEGQEKKAVLPGKDCKIFALFLDLIYQFSKVDYNMTTDRKVLKKVLEYAHEYNVNCVKQYVDYILLSKIYARDDVEKSTKLALEDLSLAEKYGLKEVRRFTLDILIKDNNIISYDHNLFNELSGETKFEIIKGKLQDYLPKLSKKERGCNIWSLLANMVNIECERSPVKPPPSSSESESDSDVDDW